METALWYQRQKVGVAPKVPVRTHDQEAAPKAEASTHPPEAAKAAAALQSGMYDEARAPKPAPADGKGQEAAGRSEEEEHHRKLAEADAVMKTTILLNADRVGKNRTGAMLDALRGAKDMDAMRRVFEERTGQKLDDWMKEQTGGADKEEDKGLNQKEAEALLSGNKQQALFDSIANCKKGDEAKLQSILASCGGDKKLIETAKMYWTAHHEGDDLEGRLSGAQKALLIDGDVSSAKGHELRDARGSGGMLDAVTNTNEKAMEGLLRSAKDPKERDQMLLIFAQTKNPSITDPKEALAFFMKDSSAYSSGEEREKFMALAQGDTATADAINMQAAMKKGDLEGMNSTMSASENPNEPGLSPEERRERLEKHKKQQEQMEASWFKRYGDPKNPKPPAEQFSEAMNKAAEKGDDAEIEKKRLAASRGEGGMNPILNAEYAVKKGDVERVEELMEGLDKGAIDQMDEYLRGACDGKTLGSVIAKTSGRKHKELMRDYVYGAEPTTDEDRIAKAKAIHADQLGDGKGALSGVTEKLSGADDRMHRNLDEIQKLEAKKKAGGLNEAEREKLERTLQYMEDDSKGLDEDKGTVGRGAKLAGKAAVGAASGGLLSMLHLPFLATAMMTSAASEGTGMLVSKGVHGDDYGANELKRDAITSMFKVAAAGLGHTAGLEHLTHGGADAVTDNDTVRDVIADAAKGATTKTVEGTGKLAGDAASGERVGGKQVAKDLGKEMFGGLFGGAGGALAGTGAGGLAGEGAKKAAETVGEMGAESAVRATTSGKKEVVEGGTDDIVDKMGELFQKG